jgi:hypothetical protein
VHTHGHAGACDVAWCRCSSDPQVAEARARKKQRAEKKMDKLKKTAESIAESTELDEMGKVRCWVAAEHLGGRASAYNSLPTCRVCTLSEVFFVLS